jgi:hypothetical protein
MFSIGSSSKVQVGEMFMPSFILSLKWLDELHRCEEAVPPSLHFILLD